MNKKETAFLNNVQKQLDCKLGNCGEHITFEITEDTLKYKDEDKQVYIGKCAKCNGVVKVKANDLHHFHRLMGKAKVVVLKSVFDTLFVEPDK
jgi:hypothetical protein